MVGFDILQDVNLVTNLLTLIQFKNCYLRRYASLPDISEESESAVNIQVLLALLVQSGPMIVNVFCGTPPYIAGDFNSHLCTMRVAAEM
jgi:hypothetical protein